MKQDGRCDPPLRIGVIGAGRCGPQTLRLAERVGAEIAAAGAVLVCGGLGGVMEGAARGASESGGLVIGVLPGYDPAQANPWVGVPVPTGLGHARNVVVVAASEAIIALPGAAGTRSEIALGDVLARPIVTLGRAEGDPEARCVAADPADAVRRALRLARRARSGRRG
jgi:uncharacterized protein (TIGR00725 family)